MPTRRDQLLHERAMGGKPREPFDALDSRARASSSAHRATSRPQLSKRGLTTTGPTGRGLRETSVTHHVRGCGRPAPWRSRAVTSLSCAAMRALVGFRTRTPRASNSPSERRPPSIPSSPGRTSTRPTATSPGTSHSTPSSGVAQIQPPPPARARRRFVSFSTVAMRAKRMPASSGRLGRLTIGFTTPAPPRDRSDAGSLACVRRRRRVDVFTTWIPSLHRPAPLFMTAVHDHFREKCRGS